MPYNICMVSDFFYPSMGGVETHIWSLSQCLIQRGHKVIVVTHAYGDRQGIRYMTNGLKVYYLPLTVIYDQVTFPTFFGYFGLFRSILIRENISMVHGHQATSSLTNECLYYARTMGYRIIYTDHSLFGFHDVGSIHVNKVLEVLLSDIDHVICVSHACRENLVMRGNIHPVHVSTIPNAVDTSKFLPNPSMRYPTNTINIVMLSRLVHRKGIGLAVDVIPAICAQFQSVHFIIGGDGPMRVLLEEMREAHQLHDRVELLGAVEHEAVRDVLCRGHIFLNCSLTESFCMALLEAASCGLFVVSTKVGGVPEVLPHSMINYAEPNVSALVNSLVEAVAVAKRINPLELHTLLRNMYSWINVAARTESVYELVTDTENVTLAERYRRYMTAGRFGSVVVCFIITCMHLLWQLWEFLLPAADIELAVDLPTLLAVQTESRGHGDPERRARHENSQTASSGPGLGVSVSVAQGRNQGVNMKISTDDQQSGGRLCGNNNLTSVPILPSTLTLTPIPTRDQIALLPSPPIMSSAVSPSSQQGRMQELLRRR